MGGNRGDDRIFADLGKVGPSEPCKHARAVQPLCGLQQETRDVGRLLLLGKCEREVQVAGLGPPPLTDEISQLEGGLSVLAQPEVAESEKIAGLDLVGALPQPVLQVAGGNRVLAEVDGGARRDAERSGLRFPSLDRPLGHLESALGVLQGQQRPGQSLARVDICRIDSNGGDESIPRRRRVAERQLGPGDSQAQGQVVRKRRLPLLQTLQGLTGQPPVGHPVRLANRIANRIGLAPQNVGDGPGFTGGTGHRRLPDRRGSGPVRFREDLRAVAHGDHDGRGHGVNGHEAEEHDGPWATWSLTGIRVGCVAGHGGAALFAKKTSGRLTAIVEPATPDRRLAVVRTHGVENIPEGEATSRSSTPRTPGVLDAMTRACARRPAGTEPDRVTIPREAVTPIARCARTGSSERRARTARTVSRSPPTP